METPKEKIKIIMDRLGMSGNMAAKAMGMSYNTFRKKIMQTTATSPFIEKNYDDLVNFLIAEIKTLITTKNENELNNYENIIIKLEGIFTNYDKNKNDDDYILFNEIVKVINRMEIIDKFSDMIIYSKVINYINTKCELLTNDSNVFTVNKYDDYALGDKKNKHTRWVEYMIYRRQQTINDILYG
jgi:hypothetical protein